MRRRRFLMMLAGAGILRGPLAAAAAPRRSARIGRLSPLSASSEVPMLGGLRAGLQELGWIEGQNLAFELRFANGQLDRLPELAADLVRQNVDVIVTGSNPGALAAKMATATIPIVFVTTGDPITGGLVTSLSRPEGNLTGVTTLGVELNAKRLELLKDTLSGLNRIGVLTNPRSPYTEEFARSREAIARALAVELHPVEVRDPAGLAAAFEQLRAARVGALLVLADIVFVTHRQRIIDLAAANRLPAVYPDQAFINAGGLMFYGSGLPDMYRHAASYVDKILNGAKPEDLPVEQPTKFSLVINLKTAKALGLTIPSSVMFRADQVVE
ncbi:MAG: ABC transporter substrate-binding protein [Xanthobacteraceae bacterium]